MLDCMGLVPLKASLLPAVKPLVDVISNYNQQDGKLEVQKLVGKVEQNIVAHSLPPRQLSLTVS